jgi:hypothetical protein
MSAAFAAIAKNAPATPANTVCINFIETSKV